MEDIDKNKDVTPSEDNENQKTIENLQAKIDFYKKKYEPVVPANESYVTFENKGETPINQREQQLMGASIQADITKTTALINEYKPYFPTSKQEKIDEVFKVINGIPAKTKI